MIYIVINVYQLLHFKFLAMIMEKVSIRGLLQDKNETTALI